VASQSRRGSGTDRSASSIAVEPMGASGRPLTTENSVLLPDSNRPNSATLKRGCSLFINGISVRIVSDDGGKINDLQTHYGFGAEVFVSDNLSGDDVFG
jgi:hypothetical protein